MTQLEKGRPEGASATSLPADGVAAALPEGGPKLTKLASTRSLLSMSYGDLNK